MQLPNRASAFIQIDKLTKYLLAETHKVGKGKAKFFRVLGFDSSNLELLEDALRNIARKEKVVEVVETEHGHKYVIIGSVTGPSGKSATILTVWMIDVGANAPRFITARPYKEKNA
ncbi:MAG: DUF6883 domain-containing protein [Cyanobacteria bacterium J06649_4]